MSLLTTRAELRLHHLPDYQHLIVDRLASFEATIEQKPDEVVLTYPFGTALLGTRRDHLVMELQAGNADGLQRLRELVTVAVQIYAKHEKPQIVWQGDLAGSRTLVTFRKMRVRHVEAITPHMRRVRLEGENLGRYGQFGGMHLRVLFPTPQNPDPVWPVAGPNGLPLWPSEERRPAARVYTIRHLDVEAGFMDIDFVVHDGEVDSVGSNWVVAAKPGDEIGIIGPLGRPIREADWYVLGCDETGLPALSRILEGLPAQARGCAFAEVAGPEESQEIAHPDGFTLSWIYRDGVPPGEHRKLLDTISAVEWPVDASSFGWFAAEAEPARILRNYWRNTLSRGRDQTLVAGYWQRGVRGLMAG